MRFFRRTFALITAPVLMLQANGFHHSALKIRSFKMVYDIVVLDAYVCPKNGPTTSEA